MMELLKAQQGCCDISRYTIYSDIRYFLYIAISDIYIFWRFNIFFGVFHEKNLRGNRQKSTVIGGN